jgi:hypothetical protein
MSEDEQFGAFTDAGLVRGDDVMWFDVEGGVGGVPTEVGAFLGWVDVTWLGPADPLRQLPRPARRAA